MRHQRIVPLGTALVSACCPLPAATGQTVAVWNDTVGGSWFDATNWAGGQVPQNTPEQTFDSRIDAIAYLPYVVSLAGDAEVTRLRLNSERASLRLMSGTLRVIDRAQLFAGRLSLVGGTIDGGIWEAAPGTIAIGAHPLNHLRGVTWIGDLSLAGGGSHVRITDGISVNGRMLLTGSSSFIELDGEQTIEIDEILFGGATDPTTIRVNAGGQALLSPNSVIRGHGMVTGPGRLVNAGSIVSAAPGRNLTVDIDSFENCGVVRATHGTTCVIGADDSTWTNAANGRVDVDGGSIEFRGNWANLGQVDVASSTARLLGQYDTASLGGFVGIGGFVQVLGQLNNEDAVLSLSSAETNIDFGPCTIRGGTIAATATAPMRFTSALSRVESCIVDGPVELHGTASVRFAADAEVSGPLRFFGSDGAFHFDVDIERVLDDVTIECNASPNRISADGDGLLTLGANQVIQGAQLRITTGSRFPKATAGVSNYGIIRTGIGESTIIDPHTFENHGLIEQLGGQLRIGVAPWHSSTAAWRNGPKGAIRSTGGTLEFDGNWSSEGVIDATDTRITFRGAYGLDSLESLTRTRGSLTLTGTLDLLGNEIVFDENQDALNIQNLTFRNGSVRFEDGGGLQFSSAGGAGTQVTFENVHVEPSLDLRREGGAPFVIQAHIDRESTIAGPVLLGPNANLHLQGGRVWESDINFDENVSVTVRKAGGDKQLILAPKCVIQGGGVEFASHEPSALVNRGTIACGHAGQWVRVSLAMVNDGMVNVGQGAQFVVSTSFSSRITNSDSGTINITGPDSTFDFSRQWANRGLIQISEATGTFGTGIDERITNDGTIVLFDSSVEFLDGVTNAGLIASRQGSVIRSLRDFECSESSTLEIEILDGSSQGSTGQVDVDAEAILAGVLRVTFGNGHTPTIGETHRVLTAAIVSGAFAGVDAQGLPPGMRVTPIIQSTHVDIRFEQSSPIPESISESLRSRRDPRP
ncbi:MAG: hypothetical protein ACKVS9_18070 [Phycisphaerae bacterium]